MKDALNKYKKKIESGNYCFPSVKAYKHHARNRKFFEESRFYNFVNSNVKYAFSDNAMIFTFYMAPIILLIVALITWNFFFTIPFIIMAFFRVSGFFLYEISYKANKSALEMKVDGLSIHNKLSIKKLTLKEFEELVKDNTGSNFEEIMRIFKKEKRLPLEIDAHWAKAIHLQMIKDVEKHKEKASKKERKASKKERKVQLKNDLELLIAE